MLIQRRERLSFEEFSSEVALCNCEAPEFGEELCDSNRWSLVEVRERGSKLVQRLQRVGEGNGQRAHGNGVLGAEIDVDDKGPKDGIIDL